MVPVSGRLPDDLYKWLATQQLEGAATNSDKLRVAVATLKRLHEGDTDYMGALDLLTDLGRGTRRAMTELESQTGQHSEVLAAFSEHLPVLTAMLNSAVLKNSKDAARLEEQLVRRVLLLCEALLRQALLPREAAYDAQVVQRNSQRLIQLIEVLSATNAQKGNHG